MCMHAVPSDARREHRISYGVRAGCKWPRENPGPQEEQPVSTLTCQTIFPGPKDFFLKTGFCVAQAGFALRVLQSLPPEW